MGLSGSSLNPGTAASDGRPSECPMRKQQSQSTADGECPASVGTGQPTMSHAADIDPTNMVSTVEKKLLIYFLLQFCMFCNWRCCCSVWAVFNDCADPASFLLQLLPWLALSKVVFFSLLNVLMIIFHLFAAPYKLCGTIAADCAQP